jgi:hypothetical protein
MPGAGGTTLKAGGGAAAGGRACSGTPGAGCSTGSRFIDLHNEKFNSSDFFLASLLLLKKHNKFSIRSIEFDSKDRMRFLSFICQITY